MPTLTLRVLKAVVLWPSPSPNLHKPGNCIELFFPALTEYSQIPCLPLTAPLGARQATLQTSQYRIPVSLSSIRDKVVEMRTQDDLAQGFTQDIFKASLDEGIIRERNDPLDEVQRSVITDRGVTSPYKVQALLSACVHGTLDPNSKTPASLIIVDYQLEALNEGSTFTSATTSFTFSEYAGPNRTGDEPVSAPAVLAYGPFEYLAKLNPSTATEQSKTSQELEIKPEASGISAGGIKFAHESESTHEERYFERGRAGRHFDHGRAHNVWWNLVYNRSQKLSITPKFRVAMLVERKSDSKFQAQFKIAARGGFGYMIQELKDRWLYKTAIDDPIIFDPSRPSMGDLQGVDATKLGLLKKRERLEALVSVPGLDFLTPP